MTEWVSSNCIIFADDTKLYNVTANCVQLQDDIVVLKYNGLKCGICILMQINAK